MNERDKLAHAGRILAPDQLSDDPPIRSLTVRALAVLLLFTLVIAALAFVERPVRRGGGGTTTANTADPADPQAHTLPSATFTGDSP